MYKCGLYIYIYNIYTDIHTNILFVLNPHLEQLLSKY